MTQANLLVRGWEVVIGIETHAQLTAHTKIFSGASTAFGAEPNINASFTDLALPGTLPVLNRQAVECAIRFGLAINAEVAQFSVFDRKNYFYPDLPSGYQISQFEFPVVKGGQVHYMVGEEEHVLNLTRAHLEQDAGKSIHDAFPHLTAIDLNRAGTPLLEIVTEPELRSSAQAVAYARALHRLVTWLEICDGNMQEGSFRCDANVSVRRPSAPLGTRREIKNLNSFNHLQQAIDYEVNNQIDLLEDGLTIHQATVLFDPDTGETREMRTKEDAADYRYFPDPDLPPLLISPQWIETVRSNMPELPSVMAKRFMDAYELSSYDANLMVQNRVFADFFEQTTALCKAPKLVANWLQGEISRELNAAELSIEEARITPEILAKLISRIADNTISHNAARQVFAELWAEQGGEVDAIIETKGLKQMNDSGELEQMVDAVIAANSKSVEEYRAGKDKAFNALVGQVMKQSKGRANPGQVSEMLKKKLAP